jgi:starvation-inducible DNA-binding protein
MSAQSYHGQKDITDGLTKVLADTFILYFKTHAFHWNVEGPHFSALHEMFGEQYTEMWTVSDDIAERIRALDAYAPLNLKAMHSAATIGETGQMPDAMEMVKQLANDNQALVETIYPVLRAAEEKGDEATVDMLIGRINTHEKYAWMLNSTAKGA